MKDQNAKSDIRFAILNFYILSFSDSISVISRKPNILFWSNLFIRSVQKFVSDLLFKVQTAAILLKINEI